LATLHSTGATKAALALPLSLAFTHWWHALEAALALTLGRATLATALALALRRAALGWCGECHRDEHGEAGCAEGKKGTTNHDPAPESVFRLETAV
jgi:cytochrome c553